MNFPDLNVFKDHFLSNGQELSSKVSKTSTESNTNDYERAIFLNFTDEQEISELLRDLRTKKLWS